MFIFVEYTLVGIIVCICCVYRYSTCITWLREISRQHVRSLHQLPSLPGDSYLYPYLPYNHEMSLFFDNNPPPPPPEK